MADKTGISWTHATWNIFVGCSAVSPACKRCYAMQEAHRQILMSAAQGRETHYAGTVEVHKGTPVFTGVVNLAPENIQLRPIAWQRPRLIFVNSVSDVFHENVSDDWVDMVMRTAVAAPQHVYQILTKRPARMRAYFERLYGERWDEFLAMRPQVRPGVPEGPKTVADYLMASYGTTDQRMIPNLWLGTTVEDQRRANERIPEILSIPASVLWISMEPLLGRVKLREIKSGGKTINALTGQVDGVPGVLNALGWVITGGESGAKSRPMHPSWVEKIDADCWMDRVPHHFKQWGNWTPSDMPGGQLVAPTGRVLAAGVEAAGAVPMVRVAKKKAGRLLRGSIRDGMPSDIARLAA